MEQQPEGDILDAIQSGDIATVKKFLGEGVPVDLTDEEDWSLLHHAAALGQVKVINLLRERGCRIDLIDNEGRTPLHHAATNGDIETIRLLIAMGSNVNSVDNEGNTPLKWSVTCEQNAAIEELTKHGGTVDVEEMEPSTDNLNRSALLLHFQDPGHTLGDGNIEVWQSNPTELITDIQHVSTSTVSNDSNQHSDHSSRQTDLVTAQQCMDTNADTTQLEGDIFEAAKCGDTAAVKGYLDLGVPVDVTDKDSWSPVHHAIAHRQVEVIRLLMDRGCLMNPVKSGKQATKGSHLHITTKGGSKYSTYNTKQLYDDVFEAARCGDIATIQSYLNSGGPVDFTDKDGRTLLHCAAGEGQIKVVELLIKRGCCIDPVDKNGCNPLNYATACGHEQTVQLLKQQVNEPREEQYFTDSLDSPGRSVLYVAAASGDIHLIERLAEQGLGINIGDAEGWTPLHAAATCGQLKSVRTLLRLGGRESMTEVAGTRGTPLHQAVAGGHKDIVSLLLNEGCPINVVNSDGRSVLHIAVQYGQNHVINMLAERGLDVNIGDDEGLTPLHDAATCGQLKSVRTLLRLGGRESITKVVGTRGTPLHQAVAGGHKDIVSLLLNEGCPINVVNSVGASVLIFAAEYGRIHMIEMLTEQGLDVNKGDDVGWTPLHAAAAYGQLESVRTLIRLGGRESMTKVAGTHGTPLHQAVAGGHKDIVSLLLNEGCPINVMKCRGRNILTPAARYGQIHMIEMLSEQGLDVNEGDDEGWTPLHAAAYHGQLKSVCTLLRLGGRESMTKVAGTCGTPLHQAVAKGHKDIVSLLFNEGCPINVVDSEGASVLITAVQYGQIHMIDMLTEKGLDVNKGDDGGWTPLHAAAYHGQLKSVCTLLRLGGRESMTKVAGTRGTPLHQAVAKGHRDIVSLLLNEGCPINVVDSEGTSVLILAAQYGQIHMIEMLTELGLDINKGDDKGVTPLHAAAANGQLQSVRTLLSLGGRESMTKVAGNAGTPLHQAVGKGHKDIVSLLLNEGCPINVVGNNGVTLSHWTAEFGCSDMIEMLEDQGLDVNIGDNNGQTSLHNAADSGHVTTLKELVSAGGKIHLKDKFGLKCSDLILIRRCFCTVKQFCVVCGLPCGDESFFGVISTLIKNDVLDMHRILCLAAVYGNTSIFDTMVTSSYPLNEQKMPKMANYLSFKSVGRKLPDHFHVSEEPLNPLHISILSEYFHFSQNIEFIDKLTFHPRTRYTVNELFPNGLSPLDVARRFELHDIAVIIERAGGGPGAWADLPKEIEDKAIDRFTTLKELRRGLGEDVISRIVSLLGYPLVISDWQEVKRILEEKPKRSLVEKYVLSSLKCKEKWERVGNLLEVDEDILEKIGEEATDDDAYYSMLKYWLKHGRNVSWKTLLDAVGHFETKKTVDDITDKIVEELAPSQVSFQIGSFHLKL